jgi:molybdopterin converting factor small subunit
MAGTGEEVVQTDAGTLRALYDELQRRHRFALGDEHLKVARNMTVANLDDSVEDNDEVVFIPPVAGG